MFLHKSLNNSIFSILSYIIFGIFSFLERKVFLLYIDDIFLGYEGFFNNIFELLLLIGAGLDIVVYYKLVKAYSEKDDREINILFNIYKKILTYLVILLSIISIVIFVCCINVLNIIPNDIYIVEVFVVLLVTFLIKQFISLYRSIFIITQDDYKYSIIDLVCNFCGLVLKLFILIIFKQYILYILVSFFTSCLIVLFLKKRAKKDYLSFIKYTPVDINEIKSRKLNDDVKKNIVQKVSLAVYGGTDNILITFIFGVNYISKLSNFYLVSNILNTSLCRLFDPVQPAIGQMIYKNNNEKNEWFSAFNWLGFVIGFFVCTFSYTMFNDFISLLFGKAYIIDNIYVLFNSINLFIAWNHKFLAYYRNAFGHYELDQWFIFLGTFLNIIGSILFAIKFGIGGIMIGTVIGHLGFWIGRIIVVHKVYLFKSCADYLSSQIKYLIIMIIQLCFINTFFSEGVESWSKFVFKNIIELFCSIVFLFSGFLIMGERNNNIRYFNMFKKELITPNNTHNNI